MVGRQPVRDGVNRLDVLHVKGRVNRGKEEDIISVYALKEREGGQLRSPFM